MQPNKTITGSSAPSKPVLGQVIACVLALGVMGVGAWSYGCGRVELAWSSIPVSPRQL